MKAIVNRRQFLATTSAALAGGSLGFLGQLRPVSAAEAAARPGFVQFNPDIEPLVRFLEDTPRDRLLEETADRIRRGLSYQELLAALLLAGVRNIQPRPVGFKFHAVLVVNSAHLASLASPDADRWLPILWAVDQFKSSQARDVREGDWTLAPVEESKVPPSHKARQAFIEAMDQWDEAAADAAVAGLARTAGANELFELFARYGARDFRDIGHKAIYVANSFRTLHAIGWHHAEPVLRSLAYALLMRGNENPATSDLSADRPGRQNLEALREISPDWLGGRIDSKAAVGLIELIRGGSPSDMSRETIRLLNEGVAPQSVWDAVFDGAGELLMRNPGILSLHAVTTANALHHAFQQAREDATRRFLLLQAASFMPLFRSRDRDAGAGHRIDHLEPLATESGGQDGLEEIFAEIDRDRLTAARKALAWLDQSGQSEAFLHTARRMIFLKGRDAHDYKFSSAVLEDHRHLSPAWRNRFLASSVFYWRGAGSPDNALVQRIRSALG